MRTTTATIYHLYKPPTEHTQKAIVYCANRYQYRRSGYKRKERGYRMSTNEKKTVGGIKGIDWKRYAMDCYGYEIITTFGSDFDIAEAFGADAIRDTFDRAFNEWKDNYKYLTELVLILNWKIAQHYGKNDTYARLYDELWRTADGYACDNLEGEEAKYFYRTTD